MSYEALWMRYFALTAGVELCVAVPLLASVERSLVRRALAVLVANLASHPVAWFVLARALASRTLATTAGVEAWAVLGEAVVFALVFPSLPRARSLGISALANAASFLAGAVYARA